MDEIARAMKSCPAGFKLDGFDFIQGLDLGFHLNRDGDGINDNLQLNMQVKIVADGFAYEHFSQIRYAVVFNSKWKVTSVEVNRPRLTLNFGGVYTEEVEVSEQTSSTE